MPKTPEDTLDNIEDEAESGLRDVTDSLIDARDRLLDFAEERPLAALGAALAVGILIGKILL